jgi:LmbE family N-acetylglucosaminyl deacetylase
METLKKDDRILVLAPHPDDEILGAGGYIYTALKNKAKLQVIIATNGENFGYAVGRRLGNFLPVDKKTREFGEARQKEAIKLLKNLGLKQENIIFLGFPDKSLKPLWKKNWPADKPYYSPLFKSDTSPFDNIYKPKVLFAGHKLLGILKEIIVSFGSNIIITSSIYDDHSDHRALARFTKKAIEESTKSPNEMELYSYLIHKHRLLYPLPYGLYPGKSLNPPLSLRKKTIDWQKFPLSKKAILAKERALLSYDTQVEAMQKRLLSFLRQNELFNKVED